MFISNSGARQYTIANSLRLRSSASASASRTFGTPTDAKKFTLSMWVKLGTLSDTCLFGAGGANETYLYVASNQLQFRQVTSAAQDYVCQTNAVLRDPSAWYPLILSVDTTQATAANRVKIYAPSITNDLNPLSYTGTPSFPNLNASTYINTAVAHYLGKRPSAATYFDGYIAHPRFIDGQALDPTYFGRFDTNGVWVPKAYSGTYGANGTFLDFSDGSSTTNLCLDRSGNGNNWTPNNISLTAGATYDWMVDTPTNVYATLNPVEALITGRTISDGNLTVAQSNASGCVTYGNVVMTTGKWYWEITVGSTDSGTSSPRFGVVRSDDPSTSGYDLTNGILYMQSGLKQGSGGTSAYGNSLAANDVVGVAVDMDNGAVYFSKNGTWQNSGDPTSGATKTGAAITSLPVPVKAALVSGSVSTTSYLNHGQRPFSYTPPTGFKALCSANLPAVTIANPKKHFDVLTYAGNSTNGRVLTGLQFQPDFLWAKNRGNANDHQMYDVLRGVTKALNSNTTNAEATLAELTSFDSGGVTLGTWDNRMNGPYTYVDWLWKAGGAGVTNTAGSITSTVSANTTAGFSIVTATTPASGNFTFGHGLGVKPAFFITKMRTPAGWNWHCWHKSLSSDVTSVLVLNSTAAVNNSFNMWGASGANSTTIGGTVSTAFAASDNFVAYCFAEVPGFSKFGSYTGNGSADGPFVYCGFRPRYVMVKEASGTSAASTYWTVLDTARDTYNVAANKLAPNSSIAENDATFLTVSGNSVDFTANGFKWRSTNTNTNENGGTYIFAAFAENPFGGSNIAPSPAR